MVLYWWDKMKTKILITYLTYGNGHRSVANYIKEYFSERNSDFDIKIVDILEKKKARITKISQKIFDFLLLKMPFMWNFIYRIANNNFMTNFSSVISKIYDSKELKDTVLDFQPDIIISTHFFSSALMGNYIKNGYTNASLITVLTDYHVHSIWLGGYKNERAITIANINNYKHLRGLDNNMIYPIGIPIYPKESETFSNKRELFSNDNPLCIFFGGGGNGGVLSYPYIKMIIEKKLNINFVYIAGKNIHNKEKVDELIAKNNITNIKTFGYVTNVPDYLKIADFVISKPGGIQSTEALFYRKPLFMINSGGGQESENVKYFVENGYGEYFKSPKKMVKFLKKIENEPDLLNVYIMKMNSNPYKSAMQKLYYIVLEIINKKERQ